MYLNRRLLAGLGLAVSVALAGPAVAQDKVRVGVNPVSASLPLYVGIEK